MTANLYRYNFDDTVSTEDIECALLLAVWGCEALHGDAQTRLDAAHFFDATLVRAPAAPACVELALGDAALPNGLDVSTPFPSAEPTVFTESLLADRGIADVALVLVSSSSAVSALVDLSA